MDKLARLSWRIENKAENKADIYLYDVIGDPWEGTTAESFVGELRALDGKAIDLHVNSPGGFVNDALVMYNALLGHNGEVTAYIEGSADSAASFVVQAAGRRVIAKNASMTIHEGHAIAMGPAEHFRALADRLDEESANIADIYATRAGGTAEEWRERMKANGGSLGTTYRGEGAVEAGLADEVGIQSRNHTSQRIAALNQGEESTPPAAIDPALIPPLANGYRPPLPSDFTRLVTENLPALKRS